MNKVDKKAVVRRCGAVFGVDQQWNCQETAIANRVTIGTEVSPQNEGGHFGGVATSGDLGSLDQIVHIVDSNSAIERAVPGDGRAIEEEGAKRTFRIELVEWLPINLNRIGLRRQGLRHGLRQNELQPIKCGESVGCGRVFDHLTDSRGSEAHKHRVVHEIFFQNRASVDDPPAKGDDLCFGIPSPPVEFVSVASRPVFQLKPYFGVIVKRKSVFKFSAVVGGEAIFRSPRPQFGKQVEQPPPRSVTALGTTPSLKFTPKPKEPVQGVLGRHGCIEGRRYSLRAFCDQIIRQIVVAIEFDLR